MTRPRQWGRNVRIYRGVGSRSTANPLEPGQVRCECGKAVHPRNGLIPAHKTPRAQVSCIHVGKAVRPDANPTE
jgi:hypothetical protein